MVVHKDGSVSRRGADGRAHEERGQDGEAPEGQSESSVRSDLSDMSDQAPPTALRFAGATFIPAASYDSDVLVFMSGDDKAKASVAMLESMGLAGRWQKEGTFRPHPGLPPGGEGDTEDGPIEVSVQNSGPVGAISEKTGLGYPQMKIAINGEDQLEKSVEDLVERFRKADNCILLLRPPYFPREMVMHVDYLEDEEGPR
jgi:hypothetical protein